MLREKGNLDLDYLLDTMLRHRVTALFVVPPMLRALMECLSSRPDGAHVKAQLQQRRVRWTPMGDVCTTALWTAIHQQMPQAHVLNFYGPAEITMGTCSYYCREFDLKSRDPSVPIGRMFANYTGYVVDSSLHLVAPGCEGELLVGGAGVCAGYWRRPDLTAASFIRAPELGPGVLYRTGDLVRQRADGELLFVGRVDFQVKIRGHTHTHAQSTQSTHIHKAHTESTHTQSTQSTHIHGAYTRRAHTHTHTTHSAHSCSSSSSSSNGGGPGAVRAPCAGVVSHVSMCCVRCAACAPCA